MPPPAMCWFPGIPATLVLSGCLPITLGRPFLRDWLKTLNTKTNCIWGIFILNLTVFSPGEAPGDDLEPLAARRHQQGLE